MCHTQPSRMRRARYFAGLAGSSVVVLLGAPMAAADPVGTITEFPVPTPERAAGRDHLGPRRQHLVHGEIRQQDRPHHAGRHRSPSSPADGNSRPTGSPPGPTATSGSPSRRQPDRPDHARRARSPSSRPDPARRRLGGITAGPRRQPLVHRVGTAATQIGRITTAGRDHRVPVPTPAATPLGDHGGPRRQPLVHRAGGNRSGGSRRRARSPSSRAPAEQPPFGITAGADGNLWFTERCADKIGRITPAGAAYPAPPARRKQRPAGDRRGDGALVRREALQQVAGSPPPAWSPNSRRRPAACR